MDRGRNEMIKKYFEINQNEETTYQYLSSSKAMLTGKCIALNGNIIKQERFQINKLTFFLEFLKERKVNLRQVEENT